MQTEHLRVAKTENENIQFDHSQDKTNFEDFKMAEEFRGKEVATFFCTSENGIKHQDTYKIENGIEGVFGKLKKNFYIYNPPLSDL